MSSPTPLILSMLTIANPAASLRARSTRSRCDRCRCRIYKQAVVAAADEMELSSGLDPYLKV